MTDRDRAELRAEIATAIREAMADHRTYCRFTDDEAARLHQVPQDLDRDALYSLRRMTKAWDAASMWVGRVILFALLALLVWGLTKLSVNLEAGP